MTGLRIFVRGTEEVKIKISKCDFEKFLLLRGGAHRKQEVENRLKEKLIFGSAFNDFESRLNDL